MYHQSAGNNPKLSTFTLFFVWPPHQVTPAFPVCVNAIPGSTNDRYTFVCDRFAKKTYDGRIRMHFAGISKCHMPACSTGRDKLCLALTRYSDEWECQSAHWFQVLWTWPMFYSIVALIWFHVEHNSHVSRLVSAMISNNKPTRTYAHRTPNIESLLWLFSGLKQITRQYAYAGSLWRLYIIYTRPGYWLPD